ncbi:hypothetical protein TNCV_2207311 [Trichonephila clavipes]|uniref:Uncharacterized protein n=1 Tax=Trichonephila clavipes TaxID=2585209 RepID=A0A8X6VGL1_TRICX|nr:hypothetical protein TNCV_2207311 [Trichonephila clavipes]
MTSARGHGAIVYCLNLGSEDSQTGRHMVKESRCPLTIGEAYLKIIMSSFLVLSEGDTRNRGGVMDKCVQMLDKELWCLGPDGPEEKEEKREETEKEKKKSREREEPALDGEKGLVRDWSGKTMNAGGVEDRIWTDCTGLAYELNSITSLTNCLANKQYAFICILGCNIFLY